MKTSVIRHLSSAAVVLGLAAMAHVGLSSATAQTTLLLSSAAWNSAADGSTLSAPWGQQFGNGDTPAPSTVRIATYAEEKWAFVNNAATNEPGDNPRLQGNFAAYTATDSTLTISFDYIIPANYGNNSQIQFNVSQYINSTTTTAITIGLGRNYDRNGIYYVDSAGQRQLVGHTFNAGERVTITLSNISLATHTYDLNWSSDKGTTKTGSVTGIAFRNSSVTQLTYLTFGESSAVTSTSQLYVKNVAVNVDAAAVPEPAHAALFLLVAAGATAFVLRRVSR